MSIIRGTNGTVRAGWKVAGFLALCGASVTFAAVLVGMFAPPWASRDGQAWPVVALAALFILGSTRLCLRLEGRRAGSFRPRFTHFAIGLAGGVALVGLLAWGLMLAGVLYWQPNHGFSASLMLSGTAYFCCAVLVEELAFRGYALQRLAEGVGPRAAVALLAAAFGGYHLLSLGTNPSVKTGGADLLWTAAGPAIGAVVFGVAALRTGSIALPLGLHLGWNWTQWHFFTFPADDNPVGLWNPLVMPWHTEHPAAFRIGYAAAMTLALLFVLFTTRRSGARPLFPAGPAAVAMP
ncbi:type II CAAX endopeptidase family protein [Dactylosporangium sp. NPDC050588]|uniref:CPBP family intramembrane glutamic endopeptidase n=1 Tax=Dactylosporangium sp. NPDC050588 TaxID=3157211 RepID=UPI0033C0AF5B